MPEKQSSVFIHIPHTTSGSLEKPIPPAVAQFPWLTLGEAEEALPQPPAHAEGAHLAGEAGPMLSLTIPVLLIFMTEWLIVRKR